MKTCIKCGDEKPVELFAQRLNICRACRQADATARRWRNLYPNGKQLALFGLTPWEKHERIIRYNTAWNRAHPWVRREAARRRAKALGSKHRPGISRLEIAARMRYFGNRCWICKAAQEQVDHVKPIAKGGAHLLCNLRPICADCNRRKSARWPVITGQQIPVVHALRVLESVQVGPLDEAELRRQLRRAA